MILLIIFRIIKQENKLAKLAKEEANDILKIYDFLDEHLIIIADLLKKVERIESEENVYRKR